MKYHPDRNKGDKDAESVFKNISEAYAVLSNPEKRKQYDMFGAEGFQQRYSQEDIFHDFDFSNIFKEFGFGGRGRGQNIFSQIFGNAGQGGFGGGQRFESAYGGFGGQPRPVKGQDIVYELAVTLDETVSATEKIVAYQSGQGREKVSVKVPAGIQNGKKLRVPGKGYPGHNGGPRGDLYIRIKTMDHPVFRREGDDLHMSLEIKYSEALLGTEIEVGTIDKKTIRLKIPPATQSNAKFRLKGYGMPHMKGKGRGDAYVQVSIAVPKKLSKKQKALAEELSETGL
jgi:curved DNA-binding protein